MYPLSFLIVVLVVIYSSPCSGTVTVGAPGGPKKMSFKAPTLTEEDSHSLFVPEEFKCDACVAVAYQIHKKFDEFNKAHKHYKYKLPESEILDLVESVCKGDLYQEYGVKEVNGKKMLTGPGLDAKDLPGIIAGGGKWPNRLLRVCTKFVDEVGEEEIYAAYQRKPESRRDLENYLCRRTGAFGDCSNTKRKTVRVLDL